MAAISQETFEHADRDTGVLLRMPGSAEDKSDVKRLVNAKLSDDSFGNWLMIVENVHDMTVLFNPLGPESGAQRLIGSLPHTRRGFILFAPGLENSRLS